MLLATMLLALSTFIGGVEHRYLIVNGPEYVAVGRHMYYDYVRRGACMKHDEQFYRSWHVVVHRCYV